MDKDHIYDIIKSDDLIMQIGKDIYDSRKPAKEKDGKNKARTGMRRLARLVEATEGVTKFMVISTAVGAPVYRIYKAENPEDRESFLCLLHPKNVKLIWQSHQEVCACQYCINIEYKIIALKWSIVESGANDGLTLSD